MLITEPPHERYSLLSARVENWGPSIQLQRLATNVLALYLTKCKRTHADERAAVVQHDPLALQTMSASPYDLRNALIERIAKRNVPNNASLEECKRSDALGAVNDLVRDDEVAGLDLLLQAADGGEGDDGADADGAEGGDVGAGGDLVRRDLVVCAVAAEEGDRDGLLAVLVVQDRDRGRRRAPGRRDVQRGDLGEAGEFAEAGAADDGDGDGRYNAGSQLSSIRSVSRQPRVGSPSYVLGRAAILFASCLGDSILRRGRVARREERRREKRRSSMHRRENKTV
jgi:hypothetical protein